MRHVPPAIQRLVREFNKLPGIGTKTSERFVFYLLRQDKSELEAFARRLLELKDSIQNCRQCYTFSDSETGLCQVCSDSMRDGSILCVVAEAKDVMAFEKTGQFGGLYHVLGGVIDHAGGVGPAQLRITELADRITATNVTEVIIATNPDMEGDTTALYIAEQLKDLPVTMTKIARGLPMGGNIEFADEVTLGNSLIARRQFKGPQE